MQYRWYDAGGAVGRRRDDTTTGGVFLVHRKRECIDPVDDIERSGFLIFRQHPMHARRAAAHFQYTRQNALLSKTTLDAGLHHLPEVIQIGAQLRRVTPRQFVAGDKFKEFESLFTAMS